LCLAPFCSSHFLISSYCSGCMRMDFDIRRIEHKTLKVWLLFHNFKQLLPYTFISPTSKTTMSIIPVSILRR
jgi:hypothetical protein